MARKGKYLAKSEKGKKSPLTVSIFLHTLIETGGNVSVACKAVGISRVTAYQWKKDDPEFASQWVIALDMSTEKLEDEAARRAVHGVRIPQFYKGKIVGHVVEHSDALLMFLLKKRNPAYRERYDGPLGPGQVGHNGVLGSSHRVVDVLANSEREADRLMNHRLVSEDGKAGNGTTEPAVPEAEILKEFRSNNTADGPLPPRNEEKTDSGIK